MTDYTPENRIQEEVERLQQLRANIYSNEARLKEEKDELLEALKEARQLIGEIMSTGEQELISEYTSGWNELIAKVEK